MPRCGLNRQIILQASITLIETQGYHNFSMRELAKALNIKAASLYNHIESAGELLTMISDYAIELLNQTESTAVGSLTGDDAVRALSHAYRRFAKEHPDLYRVILNIFKTHDPKMEQTGMKITLPFLKVLRAYPLDEMQRYHWQRILRSTLHGFISQEAAGYFSHFPIDEEETYRLGIESFLDGLHSFLQKNDP